VMQEFRTSLFYLRFRYYDSAFGRFLSRDPLFSPAPREVNAYQYAAGNPVANGDPMGLKTSNVGATPTNWTSVPGSVVNRAATQGGFNGSGFSVGDDDFGQGLALLLLGDGVLQMSTVDPPTPLIDDGLLLRPVHSIVNDLSSVILP
jgi:RHS repeat-associated protein